jgi:GNAT superfamily N-acetyltransferase
VPDSDLLVRVFETLEGYYGLGSDVQDEHLARFVKNPKAPRVYDANHVSRVRAGTSGDVDFLFTRADEVFAGLGHRTFRIDPWTSPMFLARLLLEGYESEEELQLLLEEDLELPGDPPAIDIRLVESDEDWAVLHKLTRLDHEEEAQRESRRVWDEDITAQMVATKRVKTPALRFWLARADDTDCAFFSSWPGSNGVGKVEDLFTHPDFRGRGIGTALIAHCLHNARERGAGPVLIGAVPADTPKHMYAAMGFHPYCVTRSFRKLLST